eukprot:TRINITY_DN1867_c0_g2_i1.p2 TRINITY_DN1867_c0_g2~~TRINITY_DN1867_c0_g2_i1.p2  ORF type:complete len:410 (+),score=152.31 TRINITY_DN1867_c0_g2_i1:48-1277(+)
MESFEALRRPLLELGEGEEYAAAVRAMHQYLTAKYGHEDEAALSKANFDKVIGALHGAIGPVQALLQGDASEEARDACFGSVAALVGVMKEAQAQQAAAAPAPAPAPLTPAGYRSTETEALSKLVESLRGEIADLKSQLAEAARPAEPKALDCLTGADAALQAARIEEALDRISAVERHGKNVKSAYRETRQLRMETLYEALFRGRGMGLVWSAVRTVYKAEYAAKDRAFRSFCEAYMQEVGQHVRNEERFEEALSFAPTLRMSYYEECERVGCRPNSAVLNLLQELDEDGSAGTRAALDLSNNYLSAAGLRALLPTIQQLRSLRSLNLCNNGLMNDSVKLLCEETRDHPALTSFDLSENRISREGGKDLVQLLAVNPRITSIALRDTRVDVALRDRIDSLLRARADGA